MKRQTQITQARANGEVKINPEEIKGWTMDRYARESKAFTNTHNYLVYDTAVYEAAAITTAHRKRLFIKGKGEDDATANSGSAIAEKTAFHTNMISNGEFEGGTTFMVECIAADVWLPADPHTTEALGVVSDPTVAVDATYSAANHIDAIRRQMGLSFYRSDQRMLDGLLLEFPSPFVNSGAIGASVGGFVQNGFSVPSWNKLHHPIVLNSEDKFNVLIEPLATFTPMVDFKITVMLIGKRIKELYRY